MSAHPGSSGREDRPVPREAAPTKAALRDLAILGTGLLISAILATLATSPLQGTLVLAPLVAGALGSLASRVARLGGRRIPAGIDQGHGLALVALMLLGFTQPHLGLPEHSAALVAGGLFLLLAHRTAVQVLAMRPLLGRAGEGSMRAPGLPFLLLPFVVYLALLPWAAGQHPPDGDEPFYLLMTHSLAYDLDVDLTNDYAAGSWRHFMDRPLEPQPGDPVGPGGELYSRHNMLLPLVLAPFYRLAGKAGALVVMALLAAILAWMVLRLARHYVPHHPGGALLAWAATAFASPLVLYSYQVWVEVPAALLAMVALDQILVLEEERRTSWGWRQWLGIGLPVLLLPLVKIRFMLLAGPLVVLAWWHSGRPKKALIALALLLAVVGGGLLVHNQLLYDNPLKIHHWEELELHRYGAGDFLEGIVGLFWDSAFGLFAATPLWLLLLPALVELTRRERARRRAVRREPGPAPLKPLLHLAVLTFPYLLIVVPRSEWYGGWSPPFRYALVALPLLAILLAPLLEQRHRGGARLLLTGLGAVTLGLMLLWLAVPGWTYNFADGRTYLLDHLSTRLGADAARLFPSTVRPGTAAWAWPLASALLAPLLWYRPKRLSRSGIWGTAAALGLLALVPVAAAHLPTTVVEMEDPWVRKSGGGLYPDRWSIDRTRYRGGWIIHGAQKVEAPVVPGGEEVEITLWVHFIRNGPGRFPVEIRAGEHLLRRWRPGPGDDRIWRTVEVGAVAWPEGEPLVVQVIPEPGALNGVILDKALLDWR